MSVKRPDVRENLPEDSSRLTIGDFLPSTHKMMWGDVLDGERITFLLRNIMTQPVDVIKNTNYKKTMVYFAPEVTVMEDNKAHFLSKGEKIILQLPLKAVGEVLLHALRMQGLLHDSAVVTIQKTSAKKSRVVSVRPLTELEKMPSVEELEDLKGKK